MADKAGKREKIIKAALVLLTKHGFHAAPMSLIAKKAGVAAGTIYTYFENKDELIKTIFTEIQKDVLEYLEKDTFESRTTKEKFTHFYSRLINYLITKPLHYRYLEQFHNSPFGITLRREIMDGRSSDPSPLSGILREGVEKGEMELKDLPHHVMMAHIFGPVLALARENALGFISLDEKAILLSADAAWDSVIK